MFSSGNFSFVSGWSSAKAASAGTETRFPSVKRAYKVILNPEGERYSKIQFL